MASLKGMTLSRFIVDHQQIVDFAKRACRAAFAFGLPSRHAPHERSPPSIGRRIAERSKERRVRRGVKGPGPECQRWFERKPSRMPKPVRGVLERGALLVLAQSTPETPREMGDAIQVDVDQNLPIHHAPAGGFGWRGIRIRLGRCSSSS